jgi:predicted O-methyltransferase YrrM
MDDDTSRPNERLLEISIAAIERARRVDLDWLTARLTSQPDYPGTWPGEHYKLFTALALILQPKRIVEIGTFQGLSALAFKSGLSPAGEVVTVDIVPWDKIQPSALRPADFEDGRLRQVIGDLADKRFFSSFKPTLADCELLFVDAPKNIVFEQTLLEHLAAVQLPRNALVLFDDIRQWNMLKIWREITRPKLDLTSFGHWTGTGVIDWNG